ncbi:MAG: ADP-ribosyltransferase [candidate division WOR-3 bacterium]
MLEITKKFTKNRLYDFEFDFFPDREKVEELFKELQKKKGISLINVENKIIDKMPFELKDIALKQKYQFKNRPDFKPNEEEQKTIKNYTLTNYVSINDALRSNEITGKVRKDIEILQGVFLKYKQNGDLNKVLYRGVSVDKETFQKLLSLKEGEILKNFDNAFASTSYDEKVASNFVIKKGQYGVIFKIVKRKTPGIELEKFSLFPHEKEVLLPYSFWNRLKILSKNIKNNIIEIEVEEI